MTSIDHETTRTRSRRDMRDRHGSPRRRVFMLGLVLLSAALLPACKGHPLSANEACPAMVQRGSPPVPRTGETAAGLEELQAKCRQ
jgi:hypothetical protein